MCQASHIQSPRGNNLPVWSNSVPIHADQDSFWSFKPHFAILAVSRQICVEASSVLYEDGWFGVHYRNTDMDTLPTYLNLDLGGPAVNLYRVRRLILSFNDDFYWELRSSPLSNGIKAVLEYFASHTASLVYLGLNLYFQRYGSTHDHRVLSWPFENPDLLQVLRSFTLRDEVSIRLGQNGLALADAVEHWALFIAEQQDLCIYKHTLKHLPLEWTFYRSVDWSVVPRGKMPFAAWNFSADMKHLPVSGRIVDSTEKVIYEKIGEEDTEKNGAEENLDEQDVDKYDDNDDGDDGDGDNSEEEDEDRNAAASDAGRD